MDDEKITTIFDEPGEDRRQQVLLPGACDNSKPDQ